MMNSLSSYGFTEQSSTEPLVCYVHCSPWYDVFTEEARYETWNILGQIFDRISVIIKTQTYVTASDLKEVLTQNKAELRGVW